MKVGVLISIYSWEWEGLRMPNISILGVTKTYGQVGKSQNE